MKFVNAALQCAFDSGDAAAFDLAAREVAQPEFEARYAASPGIRPSVFSGHTARIRVEWFATVVNTAEGTHDGLRDGRSSFVTKPAGTAAYRARALLGADFAEQFAKAGINGIRF